KAGVGGVQSLFLNLGTELNKLNVPFKLLYFKNTWLTQEMDKRRLDYKLFDLEEDDRSLLNEFIHKDDIIVTTNGIDIKEIFDIKPYFFFWIVFPEAFVGNLSLLKKGLMRQ